MKQRIRTRKGAAADDAAALEGLDASLAPIVAQNRHLILRAGCRDFNPATELDFTLNGAGLMIRRLFEAVAAFAEGCVPWQRLEALHATTNALVNAIKLRRHAPVAEIDAVGVAFRECYTLWRDTHSPPRMARKTYLKQIFAGRASVFAELKRLHAAYVKAAATTGQKRRTLSAADVMPDADAADKSRIFAEIDRLRKKGMSAAKAIGVMMHGSYAARMRGRKPATWARYYKEHCRGRAAAAQTHLFANAVTTPETTPETAPETTPETVAATPETMPKTTLIPVATTPKPAQMTMPATTPETTPKTTPETTPEKSSSGMARILSAIRDNPKIRVAELAGKCGLSKDGVKWNLRRLKALGVIRRIGANKGGWWDVVRIVSC